MGTSYPVGIFLGDDATILNPLRYVQAIVAAFVSAGGLVRKRDVHSLQRREGGGWSIQSDSGTEAFSPGPRAFTSLLTLGAEAIM